NRPDVEAVRRKFIQLYVPTIRALLYTQDFIDAGSGSLQNVNKNPDFQNSLLLDLNAKPDPNAFAGILKADGGQVIDVYATGNPTVTKVIQSPASGLVLGFQETVPHLPRP